MLIDDNYNTMKHSEVLANGANVDYRVRVSVEFLNRCEYSCPGCFVNRKNSYKQSDIESLSSMINIWNDSGFIFDELILGPTDCFASDNYHDLLSNQTFNSIFKDGNIILTLLSVLQKDDESILKFINDVNTYLPHPNQEIEMLVVIDYAKLLAGEITYIESIKRKLLLLDNFNAAVDYAMQINIDASADLDTPGSLARLSDIVRDNFDTVVEFNPSFIRTKKQKRILDVLNGWKRILKRETETVDSDVLLTIANEYHAGLNEVTYNYKDGTFYHCPFIYENVFDSSDPFVIPRQGAEYTLDDFKRAELDVIIQQYEYAATSSECSNCSNLASCVGKEVLYYMKTHELTDCILSKPALGIK